MRFALPRHGVRSVEYWIVVSRRRVEDSAGHLCVERLRDVRKIPTNLRIIDIQGLCVVVKDLGVI